MSVQATHFSSLIYSTKQNRDDSFVSKQTQLTKPWSAEATFRTLNVEKLTRQCVEEKTRNKNVTKGKE